MHSTYLFTCMDEASNLLGYITISPQHFPTGYRKLSLDTPLVDQVVDPSPSLVYPTLSLKSEVEVVDLSPSLVDPTLSLESEVKVVESMSSPHDPTLSSESVETKVVPSTQSSPCRSLLIETENHPAKVFIVSSYYSMQEEILSLSIEPSLSSQVISFDWSNLRKSRLHSSVPFQIAV